MNSITKSKIEYLIQYVEDSIAKWRKLYSGNLIGARIGRKIRSDKELNYYSIILHVKVKRVKPKRPIPKYFYINIPGIGIKKVPTDIVETGEFRFRNHISIADRAKPINVNTPGTIGPILIKNRNLYVCSNMHVLGSKHLMNRQISYIKAIQNQLHPDTILYKNNFRITAFLEQAIFLGIDAAIARISKTDRNKIRNSIPGQGIPTGLKKITLNNYRNYPVKMQGSVSGTTNGKILGVGVSINGNKYGNAIELKNLIVTDLFSQRGDSGSVVFDSNLKVIGIIVGGDDRYTYVISITSILGYFKANLYTKFIVL